MIEYINDFVSLLDQPFMLRAIYGGVLVSVLCGVVGIFMTLKKESFIADGIAHASLAGVAIGVIVSGQPLIFAILIGIVMAVSITYIKQNTNVAIDSAIGIIYPFLFSLGILLIYIERQFTAELETYIFGSLVSISNQDIFYIVLTAIIAFAIIFILYKDLIYSAFDRDFAKLGGVKIERNEYILNIITAIIVVVSVKLVGIVLVTALLVIPSTHAKIHAKKFADMLPIVLVHSVLSVLVGLFSSLNFPPGPIIVIVSTLMFFGGVAWKWIMAKL